MPQDPPASGGAVDPRPASRRAVIRGLRGLRDIVCLSAVLTTLAEVPGIARVRRVSADRGEIEVEGASSAEDLLLAIEHAAQLLAELEPAESDHPADAWLDLRGEISVSSS